MLQTFDIFPVVALLCLDPQLCLYPRILREVGDL